MSKLSKKGTESLEKAIEEKETFDNINLNLTNMKPKHQSTGVHCPWCNGRIPTITRLDDVLISNKYHTCITKRKYFTIQGDDEEVTIYCWLLPNGSVLRYYTRDQFIEQMDAADSYNEKMLRLEYELFYGTPSNSDDIDFSDD